MLGLGTNIDVSKIVFNLMVHYGDYQFVTEVGLDI